MADRTEPLDEKPRTANAPKIEQEHRRSGLRFRQRTDSLGGACRGIDLTKALQLASALEDEDRRIR